MFSSYVGLLPHSMYYLGKGMVPFKIIQCNSHDFFKPLLIFLIAPYSSRFLQTSGNHSVKLFDFSGVYCAAMAAFLTGNGIWPLGLAVFTD